MKREERRSGQGDWDSGVAPRPPASPSKRNCCGPGRREQGAGMASGEAGAYGHPPAGKREWGSARRRAQPCPRAAEEGKSPADGPERTEAAGPTVSGRRTDPRPPGSDAERSAPRRGDGARSSQPKAGNAGLEPAALCAPPRRAASHQERHGCAQNRLFMKSLKSEARVVPWRRRGGCSPAPAAAPPRFRLLFRQQVGSSAIGQFKPPPEPLGFRHLGALPPASQRCPAHFRASHRPVARETRDASRADLSDLVPPFRAPRPLRHFCLGPPGS